MVAHSQTFHALPPLVDRARELATRCDVVSFDVFDTLLIRRNHHPDDLKMATARFIARKAAAAGITIRPEKVQRLRDKVEAMHRRRAARQYPDHEAAYEAFMTDVLKVIFGAAFDALLLDDVAEYELSIEDAFLVARVPLLELARELKPLGKKLVAISDMYLPAKHIRRLLDRAGFAGLIDEVFSSADSFKAKASGAAWPLIREQLGVDPDRWLHIGDNPISDGARPADAGIRSLVLHDIREWHRKLVAKTYADIARYRPYWRGRLAQQWMLPLEGENVERNDLYEHGFAYFGPLLCSFVQHIAERALEEGVTRVYFLSREGQILHDIWNAICPVIFAGRALPETHYLYVSRMALAGASCAHQGLDHESARVTFLPAANRDFRDLCRVFNLDPAPFAPVLARHGLREDTPLSRWHEGWEPRNGESFRRMVEHDAAFQDEVKRQARPVNDALMAYLESENFFGSGHVALVDIGWLGNIQRFLHRAIRHRDDRPVLHGHLLVCAAGYPFPYALDNRLEGFFHDHKKFGFVGSLILFAQELFEETTRANHASLMTYALDAHGKPVLKFRSADDECAKNELLQSRYFEEVQKGILDCARRYGPAVAVLGYVAREWKPWLEVQTVNRIAFPRTRDVDVLTRIHHLDDFAAGRTPSRAARKAMRKLWNRPTWQLRFIPFLRLYFYVRHAVHWLRS